MIEKITDQNLEKYDSRLKEWCDRKFFEKGNYGKYQTTEESGAVAFYPTPNTPLEGKVKFSFKETMPTEGDKEPNNSSTITGISNITVTHCESEGIDSTDYTISLGNTYYGGEIDLATGVMTVTWIGLDLDSIKDKFNYGYNVFDGVRNSRRYAVKLDGSISGLPAIVLGAPAGSCLCTHFLRKDFDVPASNKSFGIFEQQLNSRWFMFYDDSLTITDDSKTNAENLQVFQNWLAAQKANGTPVEYVYMLDIPQIIQLTPQQIFSLTQTNKYTPRLNTVYTDADSVQISYLKSPIRDEYEKTQAILSLGGNS